MRILGYLELYAYKNKSGGEIYIHNLLKQLEADISVITDGEDYCQDYIKNVFWCGIGGTTFRNGAGFDAYKKEKQCVTYDSKTGMFVYV